MTIAIDVDEVLVDFMREAQACFVQAGLPVYEPSGNYDVFPELTPEQQKVFLTLGDRAGYMVEFRHAREVLGELRELDTVVALTAPWAGSTTWHRERVNHLRKLGFFEKEIVFCPSDLKQFFSVNMLIEDRTETLIQWAKRNPLGTGICLATPWNTRETPALAEISNAYLAQTPQDIYRIARKDYEQ